MNRLIVECHSCKNDAIITPKSVDVLGDCPTPDDCMKKFMRYVDSGLVEKDFNMLMMLFPTTKSRYGVAESYYATQINDMMYRLGVDHRMVVEGDKVKVWINADAPCHVQI